ncbi:hypothetical protein Bca52824_074582 [Brassica carinata]|uniref:Uncharacterized protein n=1 Tax=Brassica carinata TaxID=52824 RepID=A0A8X7PRB5_BRACI|nr:hypothetical protein Bca52824_074582 [Brassica carinata]
MGVDMLLLDSQVCYVPLLECESDCSGDDDWLPPSPKVVFDESKELGEESTIKAVR